MWMIFHSAAMFNGIFVDFPVKKCYLDIFGWKAARACCQVGLEHGNEGASLVFSLWELPKAGVGMPMNGTWGIVRPRCSRNTDHYHPAHQAQRCGLTCKRHRALSSALVHISHSLRSIGSIVGFYAWFCVFCWRFHMQGKLCLSLRDKLPDMEVELDKYCACFCLLMPSPIFSDQINTHTFDNQPCEYD